MDLNILVLAELAATRHDFGAIALVCDAVEVKNDLVNLIAKALGATRGD